MTETGRAAVGSPPSGRQLAALRRLAAHRGCTFCTPTTSTEASAEIDRLLSFRRRRRR